MPKSIILIVTVMVVFFAGIIACSSPVLSDQRVLPAEELKEIQEGIYIGGGLLYSESDPGYNHFTQMNQIPFRISSMQVETKAAEIHSTTYLSNDNDDFNLYEVTEEVSDDSTNFLQSKIEIPNSVKFGTIRILNISSSAFVFQYDLFNHTGTLLKEDVKVTLNLNKGADLDGDGKEDVRYEEYDPDNDYGLSGVNVLRFISDEDENRMTLYKSPVDEDYAFPSGILTVTPSGNLIAKLSQLGFDSSTDLTEGGKDYVSYIFDNTGLPKLSLLDYLFDDNSSQMMLIAKEPVDLGGGKTRFDCVEYDMYDAYEYLNIQFAGTLEELNRRGILGNRNGRFTIDPSIPSWSETYRDGKATIEISSDFKVFIDAHMSRTGSTLKANIDTGIQGSADFNFDLSSDADFEVSSDKFYLVTPLPPFPVIISGYFLGWIEIPVYVGFDKLNFTGFGKAEARVSIDGTFGMRNTLCAGVKYKTFRILRKKIRVPKGIDVWRESSEITTAQISVPDAYAEINMDGKIEFDPYIEIGGSLKFWGVIGQALYLKVIPQVDLTASIMGNSELGYHIEAGIDVDLKLDGSLEHEIGVRLLFWDFTKRYPHLQWTFKKFRDVFSKTFTFTNIPEVPSLSMNVSTLPDKNYFGLNSTPDKPTAFVIKSVVSPVFLDRITITGHPDHVFPPDTVKIVPEINIAVLPSQVVEGENTFTFTLYDKFGESMTGKLSFICDYQNPTMSVTTSNPRKFALTAYDNFALDSITVYDHHNKKILYNGNCNSQTSFSVSVNNPYVGQYGNPLVIDFVGNIIIKDKAGNTYTVNPVITGGGGSYGNSLSSSLYKIEEF